MNTVYFIASIVKIILALAVLSVLYDAIKERKKHILIIFLIAASILVFDILALTDVFKIAKNGLRFNMGHIIAQNLMGYIISTSIILWTAHEKYKTRFLKFSSISLIAFLALGTALHMLYDSGLIQTYVTDNHTEFLLYQTGEKVQTPNAAGKWIMSISLGMYFIFWVYIYVHYFIMLVFALISIGHTEGRYEAHIMAVKNNKKTLGIFLAFLALSVVPFKIVFHAASLGALILLLIFRIKLFIHNKDVKAKTEEERIRRENIMNALNENVRKHIANAEIEEALKALTIGVKEAAGALSSAMFKYNGDKHVFIPKEVSGFFPPLMPIDDILLQRRGAYEHTMDRMMRADIPADFSYIAKANEADAPIFIKSAKGNEDVPNTTKGLIPVDSIIALPFSINDARYILCLANKDERKLFTEEDFETAKKSLYTSTQ